MPPALSTTVRRRERRLHARPRSTPIPALRLSWEIATICTSGVAEGALVRHHGEVLPLTRCSPAPIALVLASALAGCAYTHEEVRTTSASDIPPAGAPVEETDDEAPPPPVVSEATPAPRPRLSRTITLGQGTEAQYTPAPASPPPGTTTPNVVVNNNITVQAPPNVYGYGGYYGYGYYGGYGSRGGYGRATTFTDGRSGGRTSAPPQWGSSGWEGARRTAAPGQTPGIGGNWAPAPSYGPAQMR